MKLTSIWAGKKGAEAASIEHAGVHCLRAVTLGGSDITVLFIIVFAFRKFYQQVCDQQDMPSLVKVRPLLKSLDDPDWHWKLVRIIFVGIYIVFLASLEIIQICTLKSKYFSSRNLLENMADWSVILAALTFLMAFFFKNYDISVIALSIAMLLGK